MALINCDFFSDSMGMSTSMTVILPQQTEQQIGMNGKTQSGKFKTLWLLHGFSDDNTIWMRRTSIERYVSELGIAVIMPNVHKSYYSDMVYGMPFWTFVSEELPKVARSFFPLSDKREDNFVAGLSMGGYGAFKLGLSFPERFSAAGSFSGVVDIISTMKQFEDRDDWKLIFGDNLDISGTDKDLKWLIARQKKKGSLLPDLYQCCGKDDYLYESNLAFKEYVRNLQIPLTYEEEAGYEHSWNYWDLKVQDFIKWLFRKNLLST